MARDAAENVLEHALALARRLSSALPPEHAQLYSAFTSARSGERGIRWSTDLSEARFDEAASLLRAAITIREMEGRDSDGTWQRAALRAAELWEWLDPLPEPPYGYSTRLLAAGAYQIAGYPARASGMLNGAKSGDQESDILRALLTGDFPAVERSISTFWGSRIEDSTEDNVGNEGMTFTSQVVDETVRAIGVLCAAFRWGEDSRLVRAVEKLRAISRLQLRGDSYSWLLALLAAESADTYARAVLRRHVAPLLERVDAVGQLAMERYVRDCFVRGRALAWPAQVRGITRILEQESFALCTPTGSGKTAVAELALLCSLFGIDAARDATAPPSKPLALYLTPSRALAGEIEARLGSVLNRLSSERVVVTGLYGGTDWGPTDAWLTTDDRTVLICTYHKAEALLRHLGPLFVHRVGLIVLDEAHNVQFTNNPQSSVDKSHAFTIESVVMRLLTLAGTKTRVVALSAVAGGFEDTLARWVTGDRKAKAITTSYRSTRQLVGRLQFWPSGECRIEYDRLDGRSLAFSGSTALDTPYVPNPFPPFPPVEKWAVGANTRLYAPVLWAALHLAASTDGRPRPVLISVTQRPAYYAAAFLTLLEDAWKGVPLPRYFLTTDDIESPRQALWARCLEACVDYFGEDSYEYRLLTRGIVLHHGKMPASMARVLVEVVAERLVSVVVATSTLSEGINLPFETVLIPTLSRGTTPITAREFANVVGRAGRPGYATEGQTLVFFSNTGHKYRRDEYDKLLAELSGGTAGSEVGQSAGSAIGVLLQAIETQWRVLVPNGQPAQFIEWLETTAVLSDRPLEEALSPVLLNLDGLDRVLIAAVTEFESVQDSIGAAATLEAHLTSVWRRSYAHAATEGESKLEQHFVRRGTSIPATLYPNAAQRRRLYRSSLTPHDGAELIERMPGLRDQLVRGFEYSQWSAEQRFEYIAQVAELLLDVPAFGGEKLPTRTSWRDVLSWWFRAPNAAKPKNAKAISEWFKYVNNQFIFKACWGLSSAIGLAIAELHEGQLRPTHLDEWVHTGLPWIVFWMKELFTWGTLDPVAAYLLAHRIDRTRNAAERRAAAYYASTAQVFGADEVLDATRIREWGLLVHRSIASALADIDRDETPVAWPVRMLMEIPATSSRRWHVYPCMVGADLRWLDGSGHSFAETPNGGGNATAASASSGSIEFILDVDRREVRRSKYLQPMTLTL